MKSKLMRIAMVVLLLGMVSLLSACGQSETEEPVAETVQEEAMVESYALHGDYAIDITNLGMALQFYLRIDEDNSFVLSANRQFSDDRGSGTIGQLDDTYLMIYSDSTPERSKTATFERVGPNLIFRSTLPYGSVNISFEAEDADNPKIIHHLMANKYVYEEYYDTYSGFQTVDGVEYHYVLELGAGAKYKFVSDYTGGEGSPVYEEMGSFRVSGENIIITPEGEEEIVGSILEDGALELEVRPQANADRAQILFRVATTAAHAGTWYAQNEEGVNASLSLDFFGGYNFVSTTDGESYNEAGSFAVSGQTISFSQEGQDLVQGTKEAYVLEASFNGLDWLFFEESIQGQFSGGTMVSEDYLATLHLHADGSYALLIVDEASDSAELVSEAGMFSITAGPMSYLLTLTSDDEIVRVGDIWPTGLNMTFDIEGTNFSFLLTK